VWTLAQCFLLMGSYRFVTIAFYPTGSTTADVVTYEYPEVRTAVFPPLTVIYPLVSGVTTRREKPRSQKRDLAIHPFLVYCC
jgi:hypothetical protein